VLFIREIDSDKSERILAILFDKEVSRTTSLSAVPNTKKRKLCKNHVMFLLLVLRPGPMSRIYIF
jgi:hypothetical protein